MPEPWVAVAATIRRSAKMTALPNDTARYGWVVALGEAKLLGRQGSFSPGQWSELMGRYARHLEAYVGVGLLHVAPRYCDHEPVCLRGRGPFVTGVLVIHDWPSYQREHAVRQQEWRLRHAIGDSESDTPSDTRGDSESDTPSRALSRVSVNSHLSRPRAAVPSGDLHALQLLAEELCQQPYALANLSGKLGERVKRQVAKHGLDATVEAWREAASAVAVQPPEVGQVILGASDILDPPPQRLSAAERKEREMDEARQWLKAAPHA